MKKILLSLLLFVLFAVANAQDRWTVQLNSKTLLTASAEDTTANVVSIRNLKKGSLIITYTQQSIDSKFGRRILVYNAADSLLYSKETVTALIPVATLKKWKRVESQVKIYAIPVSKDPAIKLKVRRVHLCTINFE